jgi:hypothetical protein
MVKLPKKDDSTKWETIEIGNGDTFEVCLKKPKFKHVMADSELPSDYTEERIKACVVDWRGVETEEGKPVSFSLAGLDQMCSAYPYAGRLIISKLQKLYLGLEAEERKNSEPLSGDTSTESGLQIVTSSGTNSSEESQPLEKSA